MHPGGVQRADDADDEGSHFFQQRNSHSTKLNKQKNQTEK